MVRFGTFSIVAHDPERDAWGIAVQSRFISVGAVVPWARARVGAIATQALGNARYGPDGLDLLAKGTSAEETVRRLTEADPQRDDRQVGIVDAKGRAAAFTGKRCLEWAGQVVGNGFACQGNILFGPAVVEAMARSFETTPGDLPERLLAALAAGQREGGDRRGMQSAALLIVRPDLGYNGGSDRWVDIRVDDHASPIEELRRIFQLYDLTLLTREDPATRVPLAGDVATRVQYELSVLGFYSGRLTARWDPATAAAFEKFLLVNNFENKVTTDGTAWPSILGYLTARVAEELARRRQAAPIVPGALERGPGARPPSEPRRQGDPSP